MNNKGLAPIVIIVIVLAVAIVGYFGVKKYAPGILEKKTTQVDISDWKTYRNDKYGFEIMHPSQYKPAINYHEASDYWGAGVDLSFDLENDAHLSIIVNPSDHGLCEGALEFSNDYSKIISGKQTRGIRCVYDSFVVEDYGISNQDNQFEVNLAYTLNSSEKQKVDSILNTFKFIESSSQIGTSNWKTYRSDQYGFEVKYPKSWTVEEKNDYSSDRVYIRGKGDTTILIAPIGWETGGGGSVRTENSDIYIDRLRAIKETSLTEGGDEFSSFIKFLDIPSGWTSWNFIITDVDIINKRTECGNPIPSGGECSMGDGLRYFGNANVQDQKTIDQILSTLKFTK